MLAQTLLPCSTAVIYAATMMSRPQFQFLGENTQTFVISSFIKTRMLKTSVMMTFDFMLTQPSTGSGLHWGKLIEK